MTDRKRMVIRILLFVARYVNDDKDFEKELETLVTHINVNGGLKP